MLFLLTPVFLMAAPAVSENGLTQALSQATNQALAEQNTCSPDFSQPTITFNSVTYTLLDAYQFYDGSWKNRYLDKRNKVKKYGGNTIFEVLSNRDEDQISHVRNLLAYAKKHALDSFETEAFVEEMYANQIDDNNALAAYEIEKLDKEYGAWFELKVARVHRTATSIDIFTYTQYMRTGVKTDTREDKKWQKARDAWHEFVYGNEGKNNSKAKALAEELGKMELPAIIEHEYKCYFDFANN